MFINNLKLALRNFKRNKSFSIISITGLSIAILSCIAVMTVIIDSNSYDSHWGRKDDLYRILSIRSIGDNMYDKSASSWGGFKSALVENFPEVEAVSTIYNSEFHIRKTKDEGDAITFNAIQSDTLIWELFDFKVLAGTPKKYTHGIVNLVLSENLKNKLFPNEDAVGKSVYSISSFGDKPMEFLVVGVIEDIPSNTHLRADALVLTKGRLETLSKKEYGSLVKNYVLFKSSTDINAFSNKLNKWYKDFIGNEAKYSFEFQPIEEVYFNSDFDAGLEVKGDPKVNYILFGIALLLLTIGCVNFINLSIANSIAKVKDVGVRKIIGSSRRQIVYQFLTESLLYFVLATTTALILFQFTKPYLESYLSYNLEFSLFDSINYLGVVLLVVLILTLIAGIYPALLVSGFKSINSIKGQIFGKRVSSQQRVQKILVTTQFSIALFVLVSLFVVNSQYKFMTSKDIGYNKDNLLAISTVAWNGKGDVFQNEINKIADVESSSMANWRPTFGSGSMSRLVEDPFNPDNKINVFYSIGDVNMAETLGLKLKQGRYFDSNRSTDVKKNESVISMDAAPETDMQSSIITEYTAEVLNVKALNELIPNAETKPVGIVQNFHTKSLREDLVPVIIKAESDFDYSSMLIRLRPSYNTDVMNSIYSAWKSTFPNKYLNIEWVDQLVEQQYAGEKKLYGFFMFFGILCLALAAMGVYGLVAQSTQQRIKEIGIRKVLGASIARIIILFSKEYARLVLVSILVALPIAWYASSIWLQDFVYRTSINWTILLMASLIVSSVALLTVYVQSLRAAISSPVKSLKSE